MPELRTKDGVRIKAVLDHVLADALLADENLDDTSEGIVLALDDSTEIAWDSQEAVSRYGECLFVGEDYNNHLAGDLIVVHDDGTTSPYAGGIDQALPPTQAAVLTQRERILRAMHYAGWIHQSADGGHKGTLPPDTHRRIRARALAYAKAEGVNDLLDQLLAITPST